MTELTTLFREVLDEIQSQIADDCLAFDDDTEPGIQVTLAANARKPGEPWEWTVQTGDNTFFGNAYGMEFWGVVGVYRDSDLDEVAEDAASQILDQMADHEAAA